VQLFRASKGDGGSQVEGQPSSLRTLWTGGVVDTFRPLDHASRYAPTRLHSPSRSATGHRSLGTCCNQLFNGGRFGNFAVHSGRAGVGGIAASDLHHGPISRTTPRSEHLGTSVFGTRLEATRGHDWGTACRRRSSRQLEVDVTFPIQPHAKISIDHHQRSTLLFVR
jgi:hypothetical protein